MLVSVVRGAVVSSRGATLNHVTGVWASQAVDFAQGVLYRPLVDDEGRYGGTRYSPLFFVLHGALIRAGFEPIASGTALCVFFTLAAMAAFHVFLRSQGVEESLALPASCLLLALTAVKTAAFEIRGDMLAAMLDVAGLALVARGAAKGRVAPAALAFALAFATKWTTLDGLAASVAWLFLAGKRGSAARLAALSVAGMGAVVLAAELASHGRMLVVMRACATGEMNAATFLDAPRRFLVMVAQDPAAVFLLALSSFALVRTRGGGLIELPTIAYAVTFLATVLVFTSPGTEANHLLSLEIAAVALLTVAIARGRIAERTGVLSLAALALAGAALLVLDLRSTPRTRREMLDEVLVESRRVPGPVLYENEILAVLDGQRPIVLDPFMLRVVARKDPALVDPLLARIARGGFAAIVLLEDPGSPSGELWYGQLHFGSRFREAVVASYEVEETFETCYVLRPKKR